MTIDRDTIVMAITNNGKSLEFLYKLTMSWF